MQRVRRLNPKIYDELLKIEANLYSDMNDKMNKLLEVKDTVLAYDQRAARDKLNEFKKKNRLKSRK